MSYLVMRAYFGYKTPIKRGFRYRYQAEAFAEKKNREVLDRLNEGYGVRTELEWFNETGRLCL